jgi:hypothetical protein
LWGNRHGKFMRFEVLTEVIMKFSIVWGMTPYRLVCIYKITRRHIHERNNIQVEFELFVI